MASYGHIRHETVAADLEGLSFHESPSRYPDDAASFGVGIEILPGLEIRSLSQGWSADKSGTVKVGDEIAAIDGNEDLSADRARRLMSGRYGFASQCLCCEVGPLILTWLHRMQSRYVLHHDAEAIRRREPAHFQGAADPRAAKLYNFTGRDARSGVQPCCHGGEERGPDGSRGGAQSQNFDSEAAAACPTERARCRGRLHFFYYIFHRSPHSEQPYRLYAWRYVCNEAIIRYRVCS
jgi:hypothetical protein